jgi:CBS domain-containing protein
MITISKDLSLTDALKLLVEHKVHRLVVLESPIKCLGILSQSFICGLINDNFSKFSQNPNVASWPFGDKSVKDLGIVITNLVFVQSDDLVIDALFKMHEHYISSVVILGPSNTVIQT